MPNGSCISFHNQLILIALEFTILRLLLRRIPIFNENLIGKTGIG
jgi:hypothetical protein